MEAWMKCWEDSIGSVATHEVQSHRVVRRWGPDLIFCFLLAPIQDTPRKQSSLQYLRENWRHLRFQERNRCNVCWHFTTRWTWQRVQVDLAQMPGNFGKWKPQFGLGEPNKYQKKRSSNWFRNYDILYDTYNTHIATQFICNRYLMQ